MSEPAIQVKQLHKSFGELQAVQDLSFDVQQGEIFSLLGPNGAGKTTTISMLATLLRPDQGDALVMGHSIRQDPMGVKAVLGVVPQEIALYEDLSAHENLVFWGKMYGLRGPALKERVDQVLETIGLEERAKGRVGKFSGGMKRRVNIGIALLHKPKVIYMDEPTVGIDPQARVNVLQVVRDVTAAGTTVVYTTHYLEEAESLCDRIGIMDSGKILAEGTLDELKRQVGGRDVVTVTGAFDAATARARASSVEGAQLVTAEAGRLVMTVDGSRGAVEALSAVLAGGLEADGVSVAPPSLNTLFLNLTGRELRD